MSGIYSGALFISILIVFFILVRTKNKIKSHNGDQDKILQEEKRFENAMDYVLKIVYLYNIIVSEILLYLLYKPLQYYAKTLTVGNNNKHIVCEISSMNRHLEDVLDVLALTAFLIAILQVSYTFIYTVRCCRECCRVGACVREDCNLNLICCKCIGNEKTWICCGYTCSRHGNYGIKSSKCCNCNCCCICCQEMNAEKAALIHNGISCRFCRCCRGCQNLGCFQCITIRNVLIFVIICLLAMVLVAFGFIFVGVATVKEEHQWKVILMLVLMLLGFIDNPWTCKQLISRCQDCHECLLQKASPNENNRANLLSEDLEFSLDGKQY